jgi:pimeloyl-ACP methyl ester carboxylesterase
MWKTAGRFSNGKINVQKVIIESESGINIPSLVMKPEKGESHNSIILHISDQGKPTNLEKPSITLALVDEGFAVLSIDVRGIGETDPSLPFTLTKFTARPELLWRRDQLAINSLSLKRTMLGMRTFDVLNVIHYIKFCDDLQSKSIVIVGEGLGGLWALLAASYNSEVKAVVCIRTLPSYKLLLNSHYYNVWNYFWVPGALRDFDIPDLSRLVAQRRQLWINPVNALAEPLEEKEFREILTYREEYQFIHMTDISPKNLATEIIKFLQ